MAEETKNNGRFMAAFSAAMLLIAIAAGIAVYILTDDYLAVVWTILIVFGAFIAFSAKFRSGNQDSFGPSEADAAAAGGAIMIGIGLAGIVYSLTDEVLYTAIVLLVVFAVIGMMMAFKNRSVRIWGSKTE